MNGIAIAPATALSALLMHGASAYPMTRTVNFSVGTSGSFTVAFDLDTAPAGSLCAVTDFAWTDPANKAWDEADVKPCGFRPTFDRKAVVHGWALDLLGMSGVAKDSRTGLLTGTSCSAAPQPLRTAPRALAGQSL